MYHRHALVRVRGMHVQRRVRSIRVQASQNTHIVFRISSSIRLSVATVPLRLSGDNEFGWRASGLFMRETKQSSSKRMNRDLSRAILFPIHSKRSFLLHGGGAFGCGSGIRHRKQIQSMRFVQARDGSSDSSLVTRTRRLPRQSTKPSRRLLPAFSLVAFEFRTPIDDDDEALFQGRCGTRAFASAQSQFLSRTS